ncbi:MAG: hypothetical protein V2I63_01035 [Pseudomonadales bacterium]|jgi:hypothetical protein|nr:hypothetical protein [Pseudomonadales bacterium]
MGTGLKVGLRYLCWTPVLLALFGLEGALASGSASKAFGGPTDARALLERACARPLAPTLPDGATAAAATMAIARADVRSWMEATQGYLGCLAEQSGPADGRVHALILDTYGEVVEDVAAVTAAYRAEVAAFEAARGG